MYQLFIFNVGLGLPQKTSKKRKHMHSISTLRVNYN